MASSRFILRALFDQCIEQINLLNQQLADANPLAAVYYQTPEIDEHNTQEAREQIEVKPVYDEAALAKCQAAWLDFYKKPNKSGKVLQRHPGIICLAPGEQNKIKQTLETINRLKREFKQHVISLGNKDARFEAVHGAVPNLITLAFYRQLFSDENQPYSVRFSWMHKHSITQITVADAIKRLQQSAVHSGYQQISPEQWQVMVEQEIARLNHLGSEQKLRIRRPNQVSPQINVRFSDKQRYHVSAALPFILFNYDEAKIKIGELESYFGRKNDPRKKESRYLIERLHLEIPKF